MKGNYKMNTTFYERANSKDISVDYPSQSVIDNNNHALYGKTTIPIKQYSNKFFREPNTPKKAKIIDTSKFHNQKRFNILLKKKQMFRHVPIKQMKNSQRQMLIENDKMITFGGPGRTKRAFTEGYSTQMENSIGDLEQELIEGHFAGQQSYSGYLKGKISESTSCKAKRTTEPVYKDEEKQKISQSRGLELFSKLFIKEKSLMVQKLRESPRKIRKVVSKEVCNNSENILETKRLYPVQKTEKADKRQHLLTNITKRQKISRTPMRLINNYPISYSNTVPSQPTPHQREKEQEFFELKGWQTIN